MAAHCPAVAVHPIAADCSAERSPYDNTDEIVAEQCNNGGGGGESRPDILVHGATIAMRQCSVQLRITLPKNEVQRIAIQAL